MIQKRFKTIKTISKRIGQPIPSTHPNLMKNQELLPGISFKEIKKRRKLLQQKLKKDEVIFIYNEFNKHIEREYYPNTNMIYLTGLIEPNSAAIISKNTYTLYLNDKGPSEKIFGYRCGFENALKIFGADKVEDINKLEVPKTYLKQPIIDELRIIKSKEEISLIKTAASISSKSMIKTIKSCKPGKSERDLKIEYETTCLKNNSDFQMAFPTIIASGLNSSLVHYLHSDQIIDNGDLILMDCGCKYNHYCSDMTRTFPSNGKFSKTQLKLYNSVLRVHKEILYHCVKHEKINLNNLQSIACSLISEELVNLGILKGETPKEIFKKKKYFEFFPHQISHHVGLDVHDCSTFDSTLQNNMIITVEPGIYIPEGFGGEYEGMGIRIEDMVLINDFTPEILTDIPINPLDIEKLFISN